MGRILYRGGRIYAPVPGASAILVDDGLVAWVGSDTAAAGLGEPDAVVELDGAWLAPAFVDAHVHAVAAGLALTTLDLAGSRSRSEVLERLRVCAVGSSPDALIWGTGWDESGWPDATPPSSSELGLATGGKAAYLARVDLHSAIASPTLLRAASLPLTDQPVKGQAHHALRLAARNLLPDEQRRQAAEAFLAAAAGRGIAMVHECAGPDIGGSTEPGVVRQAAGLVGIDLVTYWGEPGAAGIARARALGARPGGDIFIDGSLGSHTAALGAPYADAAGSGTLLLEADAVADHLIRATQAGLQAGFHAIGDAAIDAFVEGLGLAAQEVGATPLSGGRHRVEHLEMATPRHREVLARYGIVASVQPAFDARWGGDGMYSQRLGAVRAGAMNDLAALAAAGIPLAFGSDAPATVANPWAAVRAAILPSVSQHALSARAAFTAHTRGGQRAAHRDNAGVLREGADATFAIWQNTGPLLVTVPDDRVSSWSTDPRAGAPGLPDLRNASDPVCLATVVRGRAIFDRGILSASGQKAGQPAVELNP
jgi:predicted amidohydrolase YtcJ